MFSTRGKILFFTCLLLMALVSNAQLVDLARTPPHRPVFAATDAFDSSYLTQLEKAYAQDLPDTLKLAIDNRLVFRLSDNGIGKQHNTSPKGTGFGTELVNLLVQQLEGALTVNASHGTNITIHFKNRKPH